jgi:hypothetical protein
LSDPARLNETSIAQLPEKAAQFYVAVNGDDSWSGDDLRLASGSARIFMPLPATGFRPLVQPLVTCNNRYLVR